MAIPNYQTLMLPLLRLAGDSREHSIREAVEKIAIVFKLTSAERKELLTSGKEVFDNRIGWARTYLKKAGLLKITRWGYFCITDRGLELLKNNPPKIDVKLLYQYPEFKEFKSIRFENKTKVRIQSEDIGTPEEELENAYQTVSNSLANDLLQQIRSSDSTQFEHIVIDLLVKMGYGGNHKNAAEAIGRIGDEGIDGIINEDKLGLDRIYVQAKCWQNTIVGRPEVQKFAGALQGKHAKKGIFITTSDFTKEAREYASLIDSRIILIDGIQLSQLMVENDIGVNTVTTYKVKKIDTDYFLDDST